MNQTVKSTADALRIRGVCTNPGSSPVAEAQSRRVSVGSSSSLLTTILVAPAVVATHNW
jgi:hypothetical protein